MAGAWAPVQPGDTPASVLAAAQAGKLQAFDPANKTVFPPDTEVWLVLWPQAGEEQAGHMLALPAPVFGRVTLYHGDQPRVSNSIDDFNQDIIHGFGTVAFILRHPPSHAQPIVLRYQPWPVLGVALSFRLQSINSYSADGMYWMALTSASFGIMLAMALLALCSAVMVRDSAYAWFAGFIASYALAQGMQTGYVFRPLAIHSLAGGNFNVILVIVAIMLVCALWFQHAFCHLSRHTPRAYRLMRLLTLVLLLQLLFLGLPWPALHRLGQVWFMPTLALWLLAMLAMACLAMARGSRTARYYVICWTPLMLLTAMTCLQSGLGWFASLGWLLDACVLAATGGSMVLSLGLAGRTLAANRERDQAQALADHDPLTGLLNRRAWSEAAGQRLHDATAPWQVMLFLDLDHFKRLNDNHGHTAGDQALVAVAETLRNNLSPADILGRYGGEEFIVLSHFINQTHAMATAKHLCHRIRALDLTVDTSGHLLTASIGLAIQRRDDTMASLIGRADLAMYVAKEGGRDRADWGAGDHRRPDSPMRDPAPAEEMPMARRTDTGDQQASLF